MTTAVKNFVGGINLVPQATAPSTGVKEGDLYMDDGTTNVAGLYRYDGSDWTRINEGVTGSLVVQSKTANYTVLITDDLVLGDSTSGDITFTLPAASGNSGKVLRFKKIDTSANAVIIDGNSSETIDGATTYSLLSEDSAITIVCDGTNWQILNISKITESAELDTVAGYGSTATHAFYFTNIRNNTFNKLMTLTNDSTNALVLTALQPCRVISVSFTNSISVAGQGFGISKNYGATSSIESATGDQVKGFGECYRSNGIAVATGSGIILTTGDVLRAHGNTVSIGTNSPRTNFTIIVESL